MEELNIHVNKLKDQMIAKQLKIVELKNKILSNDDIIRLKQEIVCSNEYINNCKTTTKSLNKIKTMDETASKMINDVINTNEEWINKYNNRITEINKQLIGNHSIETIMKLENNVKSLELKINEYTKIINNIKSNNKIQCDIFNNQTILNLCNSYDEILQECDYLGREITRMENNGLIQNQIVWVNKKINDIKNIERKISELTNNISVYDIELKELLLLEEYQPNLKKWEKENADFIKWSNRLSNIRNDIKIYIEKYSNIRQRISAYISAKESHDKLKEIEEVYRFYIDMMSNGKLPGAILRNYLPIIEAEVNNIIKNYTDFQIEISADRDTIYDVNDTNKTNNRSEIYVFLVRYNGDKKMRTNISFASGFEKFITSMSFRIAFQKTLNIGKPNFCIIDEGWSCLDKENRKNIPQVIDILKDHYEHVILISHLNELADEINHPITIVRDSKTKTSHIDTRQDISSANDDKDLDERIFDRVKPTKKSKPRAKSVSIKI